MHTNNLTHTAQATNPCPTRGPRAERSSPSRIRSVDWPGPPREPEAASRHRTAGTASLPRRTPGTEVPPTVVRVRGDAIASSPNE